MVSGRAWAVSLCRVAVSSSMKIHLIVSIMRRSCAPQKAVRRARGRRERPRLRPRARPEPTRRPRLRLPRPRGSIQRQELPLSAKGRAGTMPTVHSMPRSASRGRARSAARMAVSRTRAAFEQVGSFVSVRESVSSAWVGRMRMRVARVRRSVAQRMSVLPARRMTSAPAVPAAISSRELVCRPMQSSRPMLPALERV